jgi:hypothetical protein
MSRDTVSRGRGRIAHALTAARYVALAAFAWVGALSRPDLRDDIDL